MQQLHFNEIIELISTKLTTADDEILTTIYNQLFDVPIIYVGDDFWEEEVLDDVNAGDYDESDDDDYN